MNKKRLDQFWNFGHNCKALFFTCEQAEQALEDNRFNSWAITKEEKEAFFEGFYHSPRLWRSDALKPIDIRPILHEFTGRTHPVAYSRNRTKASQLGPRSETSIRVKKFWASEAGAALKRKRKEAEQTKFKLYYARKK